jgi:hypothetical protein
MPQLELRVVVDAAQKPSAKDVLRVLEKGFRSYKLRVVAFVEVVPCPVCGQAPEITTHFAAQRKRWWQFWRSDYSLPGYVLSSPHGCYQKATGKLADADSPWRRSVSD